MKTCNPAMAIMNIVSITFMLKILFSVLLTVLKFRFSRVRKYFCCLLRVETWPESFMMVSSTLLSCSTEAPPLVGRLARGSFSTWAGVSGDDGLSPTALL